MKNIYWDFNLLCLKIITLPITLLLKAFMAVLTCLWQRFFSNEKTKS